MRIKVFTFFVDIQTTVLYLQLKIIRYNVVEFDKDYLCELFEDGRTSDKRIDTNRK